MILRAQLKPVDDIPEEAFCCDALHDNYSIPGIAIFKVVVGSRVIGKCRDCGATIPNCLSIEGHESVIDPRVCDIEEAPFEEGDG